MSSSEDRYKSVACQICSGLGLLCSILAVSSCSFVHVMTAGTSETIVSVGPFRSYNDTTHTCHATSASSFLYSVYLLCAMAIASIGVALGAAAVLLPMAKYVPSRIVLILGCCRHHQLQDPSSNNYRRRILLLLVGSCICQLVTIAMFLLWNFVSLGWGAIVSLVSVASYASSITLLFLVSRNNTTSPPSKKYAFFDVDYMEAFNTNNNDTSSLGLPLIAADDPQSNYGDLPPWVHTIQ